MKGWKLLSEKLRMLGVDLKEGIVENITEKRHHRPDQKRKAP